MSSIPLQYPKKTQKLKLRAKTDPFGFLTSIVAIHQKIEVGTLWEFFFRKKSHNAKKMKGKALFDFSTSLLFFVAKQ